MAVREVFPSAPAGFPSKVEPVTSEMFKDEIADALKAFEKYVVCLDKTPEQCAASLKSLVEKAI